MIFNIFVTTFFLIFMLCSCSPQQSQYDPLYNSAPKELCIEGCITHYTSKCNNAALNLTEIKTHCMDYYKDANCCKRNPYKDNIFPTHSQHYGKCKEK